MNNLNENFIFMYVSEMENPLSQISEEMFGSRSETNGDIVKLMIGMI